MLNQRIQQKLLQKFSPQQIQLMKMLQIPSAQLEQRIKEEIETNPALEEGQGEEDIADNNIEAEASTAETPTTTETAETGDEAEAPEEEVKVDDEIDITDYYDEEAESVGDYKTEDPNEVYDPDDENKSVPVSVGSTFHEYLQSQVGLMDLDDRQRQIALHLIGSIDDDGYLRRDPDADCGRPGFQAEYCYRRKGTGTYFGRDTETGPSGCRRPFAGRMFAYTTEKKRRANSLYRNGHPHH